MKSVGQRTRTAKSPDLWRPVDSIRPAFEQRCIPAGPLVREDD